MKHKIWTQSPPKGRSIAKLVTNLFQPKQAIVHIFQAFSLFQSIKGVNIQEKWLFFKAWINSHRFHVTYLSVIFFRERKAAAAQRISWREPSISCRENFTLLISRRESLKAWIFKITFTVFKEIHKASFCVKGSHISLFTALKSNFYYKWWQYLTFQVPWEIYTTPKHFTPGGVISYISYRLVAPHMILTIIVWNRVGFSRQPRQRINVRKMAYFRQE